MSSRPLGRGGMQPPEVKRRALAPAVFLLAAVVFVALFVRAHLPDPRPHADVVARLPMTSPAPVLPATRLTLPEQRGLHPGQVFLGWRLVDDRLTPNTLVLRWDNTLDPPLPGCGSTPVAIQVAESATAIRIGLIGPIPPPQRNCSMVGAAAYIDVHLSHPAGQRTVYEITD